MKKLGKMIFVSLFIIVAATTFLFFEESTTNQNLLSSNVTLNSGDPGGG